MVFTNVFFVLLISLSVFVFVNRIFHFSPLKKRISVSLMTKIGTFFVIYVFSLSVTFFFQPFWFLMGIFFFFCILWSCFFLWKKTHEKHFYKEFLRFLSQVLLRMRMGFGFRTSYRETLDSGGWKFQALLGELYDNVAFMPQKNADNPKPSQFFLDQLLKVLRRADASPTNSLRLLEQYKKYLTHQEKFRRRSRQIWTHILSQGLVVLALYLALLTYTLRRYSFSSQRIYILLSLLLFVIAALVFTILRKEPRWNL